MTNQDVRRPVGRPPKPGRRAELLDSATQLVAQHGVTAMSLAELAKALGCSTFTLTYHFGSKEQLLAAIVERVENELQAEIAELASDPGTPTADLLRRYWSETHQPASSRYLRLWLELVVLASRQPERFPGFHERAVVGWRTLAADILRKRTGSDALATLIVATVTGLELDLMLDSDHAAADAAIEQLIALIEDRGL